MWKVKIEITMVTAAMLVIFWLGCGEEIQEEPPVNLLKTYPADGGEMAANGMVILKFDNPPGVVTVNGIPAKVEGNQAAWQVTGLTAVKGSANKETLQIVWENKDGSIRKEATITVTVLLA